MSFATDIQKFAKKTNQSVDNVVRKSCFDLSRAIQLRTPVDTGMARNNWMPAVDAPNLSTGPYKESVSKIRTEANKAYGKVYYFTNSLPYIGKLEYGYSKQAPNGMVRLSVTEFKKTVRKAVASESK